MDPVRPTAAELAAGFARGDLDPVTATRDALARIERYDGAVNAILFTDPESAIAEAERSAARWAQRRPLSPVDGVPTTIKDLLLTRGWPTLRGSRLIDADQPWEEDAPAVARLREAGCVLLGKNATPEFGWKGVTDSLRHGATGNPWDPARTAGGSSGGAAAAVALGMGAWSVGTDGGGSVRIPGAFTGTVALKPTFGLVPLHPASPYGTLAHAGPMTRTVRDAALMLDVLAAPDPRDWSALPPPPTSFLDGLDGGVAGLRVAASETLGFDVINDPGVRAAYRAALDVLADAGALVEEVDPPIVDPVDAFHVLWFSGAAKVLEAFGDDALDRIDPGLAAAVREHGLGATASDYLDAMAVRMEQGRLMGRFHTEYDVLVTPTMPVPAFGLGRPAPDGWPELWTGWTPYTYPFNITQQPALTVPCGFAHDGAHTGADPGTGPGLPVGLQVVGPRHADALVLRVGEAFQARTDWHQRLPPLLAADHRPDPTETPEV